MEFADISVSDAAIAEGNDGNTNLEFVVSLSNGLEEEVTVDYLTSDGLAVAGEDYIATTGSLTFAAGETSQTVSVPIIGDRDTEPDETLVFGLANAASPNDLVSIARLEATGTIVDDDRGTETDPETDTDGDDGGGTVTDPNPDANNGDDGDTDTDSDFAEINVADASITEGDEGETNLEFNITLSNAISEEATVNYSTTNGTATAGTDYTETSGSLTFAPGETTQTVVVPVLGDTTEEEDETFVFGLANAESENGLVSIGQLEATGTITDDDGDTDTEAVEISVADATVTEGDGTENNLEFAITLSDAAETEVTVDYSTTDGTATAGADYTETSGSLTFAPGETEQIVSVPVIGEFAQEEDETFTFNLANAQSEDGTISIANAEATGTITNDDAIISAGDANIIEGDDGTTDLVFTVSLDVGVDRELSAEYSTSDGTATAGEDYTATSGTVTFAPGETTQTISVPIIGDTNEEENETFSLNLEDAGATAVGATGTITDNDGEEDTNAEINVSDAAIAEGNEGETNLEFEVTLSAAITEEATVNYTTSDGTATAGDDYTETSGTLTFAPGETTQTVSVPILGDTTEEEDETFVFGLANAESENGLVSIGQLEATGTITDDDGANSGGSGDGGSDGGGTDDDSDTDTDNDSDGGTGDDSDNDGDTDSDGGSDNDSDGDSDTDTDGDGGSGDGGSDGGGNDGDSDSGDSSDTIDLFRFRNTSFDSGTYVFVGEEERDAILEDEDLSNTFSLDGVQDDGSVNAAFTASTVSGDNLIPFFRLKSLQTPGTFLFVSTEEYDAIFAEDSDQIDNWEQEGFDEDGNDIPEFYLYDRTANLGTDFNRFQNTQNNTFLYAGPEETAAIEASEDLSNLFTNQGGAFESLG